MKLNNNTRIIHEDDIILSDSEKSLSQTLQEQSQQIEKLASNIKWIYKYGGVGGSGGGSGGGGATQSFSIYAQLNGIQLKDQSITLDGPKMYPLEIKINNPNGGAFNVRYSYTIKSATGSDIKQEQTVILSIENNYTFSTQINLNTNSNLQITVSDGNETKQAMCSYIVYPYEFNLTLVDDKDVSILNEHFIETAAIDGMNVKLSYVISINANIHYRYTFKDTVQEGDITDKNNTILFPIEKSLFIPSNAGFYSAKIEFDVIPDGQELIKFSKDISFSLIPEDLYMLLQPMDGLVYDTGDINSPFEYTPGYIEFKYRIYEGISQNRTYSVNIYLNDTQIINQSVVERQQYNFKIFSVKSEENTLKIEVKRGASTYTKTYYFYIQKVDQSLDYFDKPEEWTSYYYRVQNTTENFKAYNGKLSIDQTTNTPIIKINGMNPPETSGQSIINTHIAIGLQYNSINTENPVIFELFNTTSSTSKPVLTISQNKVGRESFSSNLYIKKQENADKSNLQNYHLISIYSQYVKTIGQEPYYEISLYIDGILESVLSGITNVPLITDVLQINPVNCHVNLLEVDYKKIIDTNQVNNCDYEVYKFFLKYQSEILSRVDIQDQILLLKYLNDFQVGLNGRVTTNDSTISNISSNISTPVLLATYADDGKTFPGGFIEALEASYGEDGSGPGADMSFQVSLSWSPGKSAVQQLVLPDSMKDTARFIMSLQGSSTKNYRAKNFNLELQNGSGTEQDKIYLYSPNFQEGNTKSFLPEQEFTLKADVVDSSHSNNTSCGKFINTVCRKFSEDIQESSDYKPYIKNCLDGFPFLLFLCHSKEDKETANKTNIYYYLGVYNFNLGRSSYYNLGYKNLSVFGNPKDHILQNAGNSFSFIEVEPSLDSLKEGLGVAEIQGGDPHFDFSQYHPTVLFQQSENDRRYMFGDLVYGSNGTELNLKAAISSFVEKVAKSGGYLFDYLKKTKGPYETSNPEEGAGYNAEVYVNHQPTGESKNQVPDYSKQYEKYATTSGGYAFRQIEQAPIVGVQNDLKNLILPDMDSGVLASLNFQAASEYYTICMVLGLVDSVMKNLNIKTWNIRKEGRNIYATWYPAFYDMDTCLGINNSGDPISYFAFSDYWSSNIKQTIGETEYPSDVQIYRDFSPSSLGKHGYDVPTNYLFTVAKYAKLIYKSNTEDYSVYLSQYPQELYAKWRSNVQNPKTNEGVLKNADIFMENFFSNNLAAICPALISYNYRAKYLKLVDTAWVNTDYNKFHGTRVNEVRDWVNGRLHILDAYFNLNRDMSQTITYRTDGGTWENVTQGQQSVYDTVYTTNYSIKENSDVVILQDIFSSGGVGTGVQVSGDVSFQIKCPEFSPLQIYNPTQGVRFNFIVGGDKYQQIQFTTSGVQVIKMGGSQAWSYLSSINWMADTQNLYINSKKLENIYGDSGSFNNVTIIAPNIKNLVLKSENYSGKLQLKNAINYPNLDLIDISNSKISLEVDGLNVKTINLSNMKAPNSSVTIMNCNSLQELNLNNITLNSLNVQDFKKDFYLQNSNITSLQVACSVEDKSFRLSNDRTINSLQVSGYKNVTIQDCPELNRIVLDEKVKTLNINNCVAENISITSNNVHVNNKVNLSNSTITSIKITNVPNIISIVLPDTEVTLPSDAFVGCKNLTYLTAKNVYINSGVFNRDQNFKLKNESGVRPGFKVSPTCTSLAAAFAGTQATWEDLTYIINESIPEDNSLTNVADLFWHTQLRFGLNDLKACINGNGYPNFRKLNKVTNASNMLSTDAVQAFPKKLMEMGSPNGCDYSNIASHKLYIPKDVFSESIEKIVHFPFKRYIGDQLDPDTGIVFTDASGNPLPSSQDIILSEIFNINGKSPTKAKSLANFRPHKDYTFDFTGMFTSGWKMLRNVTWVCQDTTDKYKGYDQLFKNVPNPIYLNGSFTVSALPNVTADYFEMFNWEIQVQQPEMFQYYYLTMECKKYLSVENYMKICNLVLKSTKLTDITRLFYNVTLIGSIEDFTFGNLQNGETNEKITKASLTFAGLVHKNTLEAETTNFLNINKDFFKVFPNIQELRGTFAFCKIGTPIPFDFFKKRRDNSMQVYIKKMVGKDPQQEQYLPATLHQYSYKKEITSVQDIFYNCSWDKLARQYDPSLYNIPKNEVIDSNEETYDTYYIKSSNGYKEYKVQQPTEITDAENLTGGYVSSIINSPVTNPNKDDLADQNKLIIPPDFFYGLSKNPFELCVHNCFYTNLGSTDNCRIGIIPPNIFKDNKKVTVQNVFCGQLVIPRLVASWEDNVAKYNVYSHFPEDYTESINLQNAFNCQKIVLNHDTESSPKKIINYSVMILENSVTSNISSLSGAFYCSANVGLNNSKPYNDTSNFEYNFIGKINYVLDESQKKVPNGITLGINKNWFKNLDLRNICRESDLAAFNGNIFNDDFDAGHVNATDKVIRESYYFNPSPYVKFPKATRDMQNFADIGITVKASQIIDSSTSRKYYENARWIVIG